MPFDRDAERLAQIQRVHSHRVAHPREDEPELFFLLRKIADRDTALREAQSESRKLRDLLQSAADERDKWFYLAQHRKDELIDIRARLRKEEKQMTTFGLVDRTYARGKAEGAAAERAAIVAWLRYQAETADGWIPDLVRAADAIENGEHHKPEPA
jgi:hypothetical protein